MSDGYQRYRSWHGDSCGSLIVTALTGTTTLLTPPPQTTIFLQRIHIHVSAPFATTWSIQDSSGVLITGNISVAAAPTSDPTAAEYDFGPKGFGLTPGASLKFVPANAGAIGDITFDAYCRSNAVITIRGQGVPPALSPSA